MATMAACVDQLLAANKITRRQADQVLNEERAARFAGADDPAGVALAGLRERVTRDKFLAVSQAYKQALLLKQIAAHPLGFAEGVKSILARDVTTKARWENVDQKAQGINRIFTGQMAEAMERMRLTRAGLHQDRDLIDDVVRELFGTKTGNADAALFAKQIADTLEYARERFNRAGGSIAKRADYGMPQKHDQLRVKKAGHEQWKADIKRGLDPAKIVGENGLPLTPAELEAALDDAFVTITTGGLNKLEPGAIGGTKLANRHRDHRFFVFKDADSWLAYDKQYGGGNPYFTLTTHLEDMAGDIALLEIMGPNPAHTMRVLRDTARKNGVEGGDLASIDALWMVVSGAGNDVGALKLETVERLTALRNVLSSAQLGSAILSQPSDLAFMRQTAAWNGLDQVRAINTFLGLMNPASAADRLHAVQLGLTAEAWSSLGLAANRYGEVTGTGLSARAADLTMRMSGMNHWTDSGQKAIGLEFLMRTAELRHLPWEELPAANKILLEEAGFTADDWAILIAAKVDHWKGVDRIDLPTLLKDESIPLAVRERVVSRTQSAIQTLTDHAIPSPDARTRAIGARLGPRGSLGGQAAATVLQYKSFPMAVILSHGYRGMYLGAQGGRGSYLASLTLATTAMGYLSLQLKEIAKGRTPKPLSPAILAASFAQGGGAGIFGDFVQSGMFGVNRFGGSLAETLAGPTIGLGTDLMRLTLGQVGETIEGKPTNADRDLVGFIGDYTPIIGSLVYTRLAYERLVVNQLQMMTDDRAQAKFRAQARQQKRDFGNEYWWPKGEVSP